MLIFFGKSKAPHITKDDIGIWRRYCEGRPSNDEELYEKMVKAIEQYLKECGNPHITIIATQNGVEVVEGIKATKLELND